MRSITALMRAAIRAASGTDLAWLLDIETSGGSVRLCTAPVDLAVDVGDGVQTWQGVGGEMSLGDIVESPDFAAQAGSVTLSGVDQTMVAVLLTTNVRNRALRVYRAHFGSDGAVVPDPIRTFVGVQTADWKIDERRSRNQAMCTITTRATSSAAMLKHPMPVRTNVHSHNAMLARRGLPTGDTFFQHVASLQGRVLYWGGERRIFGGDSDQTPRDRS